MSGKKLQGFLSKEVLQQEQLIEYAVYPLRGFRSGSSCTASTHVTGKFAQFPSNALLMIDLSARCIQ